MHIRRSSLQIVGFGISVAGNSKTSAITDFPINVCVGNVEMRPEVKFALRNLDHGFEQIGLFDRAGLAKIDKLERVDPPVTVNYDKYRRGVPSPANGKTVFEVTFQKRFAIDRGHDLKGFNMNKEILRLSVFLLRIDDEHAIASVRRN